MVESCLYTKGLQKTRFIYNPSVQPEKTTANNSGLFAAMVESACTKTHIKPLPYTPVKAQVVTDEVYVS